MCRNLDRARRRAARLAASSCWDDGSSTSLCSHLNVAICVWCYVLYIMYCIYVSCIMYHVSCIMCHVSCVMCHVS